MQLKFISRQIFAALTELFFVLFMVSPNLIYFEMVILFVIVKK